MGRISIIKRSVVIAGHATSVSLEPEFWEALQDMAAEDGPGERHLSWLLREVTSDVDEMCMVMS